MKHNRIGKIALVATLNLATLHVGASQVSAAEIQSIQTQSSQAQSRTTLAPTIVHFNGLVEWVRLRIKSTRRERPSAKAIRVKPQNRERSVELRVRPALPQAGSQRTRQ